LDDPDFPELPEIWIDQSRCHGHLQSLVLA
jgi:hypothetical protein